MTIEDLAKICHEANRAYCEALFDFSQKSWEECDEKLKLSTINGVIYHLKNENVTPKESHENLLKYKLAEGWKYGLVKDFDKKEHPCLLPYESLPEVQRYKDILFKNIVDALAPLVNTDEIAKR